MVLSAYNHTARNSRGKATVGLHRAAQPHPVVWMERSGIQVFTVTRRFALYLQVDPGFRYRSEVVADGEGHPNLAALEERLVELSLPP